MFLETEEGRGRVRKHEKGKSTTENRNSQPRSGVVLFPGSRKQNLNFSGEYLNIEKL
jgi:hypothetical protein